MSRTVIVSGEPFDEPRTHEIVEQFYRDGFALVPGVLTRVEVEALRAKTEELMADAAIIGTCRMRSRAMTRGSACWCSG